MTYSLLVSHETTSGVGCFANGCFRCDSCKAQPRESTVSAALDPWEGIAIKKKGHWLCKSKDIGNVSKWCEIESKVHLEDIRTSSVMHKDRISRSQSQCHPAQPADGCIALIVTVLLVLAHSRFPMPLHCQAAPKGTAAE